jgi:hypothetical protein
MVSQNRGINQLTTTEVQIVEDVAHSNTNVANRAQAILLEATGEVSNYPIVKIPVNSSREINSQLELTPTILLSMYPNPTTGNVTIAYDELLLGKLTVVVYNVLGERVFNNTVNNSAINLSGLENGIYFVNFISSDLQLIDNQKLTIQK